MACFCVRRFFGVLHRLDKLTLLPYLHKLYMSELLLMIFLLSDLNWDKIYFLSTIHILHCKVPDDFIQPIPSRCQRIVETSVFSSFASFDCW